MLGFHRIKWRDQIVDWQDLSVSNLSSRFSFAMVHLLQFIDEIITARLGSVCTTNWNISAWLSQWDMVWVTKWLSDAPPALGSRSHENMSDFPHWETCVLGVSSLVKSWVILEQNHVVSAATMRITLFLAVSDDPA